MSGGYPPMNPYMNNGMYMQPPQQTPPPQQQQQRQQAAGPAAAGGQKYWQPSYNEPEIDKAKLEKDTLDELKAELEETDALQPTINEAAIEQLAKKVSELNTSDDNIISSKNMEDQHHQHQSRRRYDNNYNNNNVNYRGRGGRYNNSNERQFNGNKTKAEFSIPTSEFDFEASNAKFDKSEIVKKDHEEADDTEEEIEIPAPDEFYDKVKKKDKVIFFLNMTFLYVYYRHLVSLIIFLANPRSVMNNVN